MATTVATLEIVLTGRTTGLSRTLRDADNNISNFAKRSSAKMADLGQSLTRNVTVPLVALGGLAVRSAMQWETAFAGVRKTVNASDEVLQKLNDDLREMATNTSAPVAGLKDAHTELAKIAELGGQLGVPVDDIASFTEVIGELTIATNLTGEEAATMLAQFANITGLDFKEFRKIGNVIVELGNNMATTEADIVKFMHRMAGAGSITGFTDAEIAAMSATTASLGLRAESAGTSMTQVLLTMEEAVASFNGGLVSSDTLMERYGGQLNNLLAEQSALQHDAAQATQRYNDAVASGTGNQMQLKKRMDDTNAALAETTRQIQGTQGILGNLMPGQMIQIEQSSEALRIFADTANMSASEFAKAWSEKPAEALTAFLKGFGEDLSAAEQIKVLEDLELNGIRVSDMIRRMAGNTDLLTSAFDSARGQWDLGDMLEGALRVEAEKRFETTAAKVNLLVNNLKDLAIVVGNEILPVFNTFVSWLTDGIAKLAETNPEILRMVIGLGAFAAALGPALIAGSKLMGLISLITKYPIVATFGGLAVALGAAALGFVGLTNSADPFVKRTSRMIFSMIGDIARQIGGIIGAFLRFGKFVAKTLGLFSGATEESGNIFTDFIHNGLKGIRSFLRDVRSFTGPLFTILDGLSRIANMELLPAGSTKGIVEAFSALENTRLFKWIFGDDTGEEAAARTIMAIGKLRAKLKEIKELGFEGVALKLKEAIENIDWTQVKADVQAEILSWFDSSVFSDVTNLVLDGLAMAFGKVGLGDVFKKFRARLWAEANDDTGSTVYGGGGDTAGIGRILVEMVANSILQTAQSGLGSITAAIKTLRTNIEAIFTGEFDWNKFGAVLKKKFKPLTDALDGLIADIDNAFSTANDKKKSGDTFVDFLGDFFISLTGIEVPEVALESITNIIEQVVGVVGLFGLIKLGKGVTKQSVLSPMGILTAIFDKLNLVSPIARGLTGFGIMSIITNLITRLPEVFDSIRQMIANAGKGDYSGVVKIFAGIGWMISTISASIGKFGGDFIIDTLPKLGTFIASIGDFISGAVNLIEGITTGDAEKALGGAQQVQSGAFTGFMTLVESLSQGVVGLVQALITIDNEIRKVFGLEPAFTAEEWDAFFAQWQASITGLVDGIIGLVETSFSDPMVWVNVGEIIKQKLWLSIREGLGDDFLGINLWGSQIADLDKKIATSKAQIDFTNAIREFLNTGVSDSLDAMFTNGTITIDHPDLEGRTVTVNLSDILGSLEFSGILGDTPQASILQDLITKAVNSGQEDILIDLQNNGVMIENFNLTPETLAEIPTTLTEQINPALITPVPLTANVAVDPTMTEAERVLTAVSIKQLVQSGIDSQDWTLDFAVKANVTVTSTNVTGLKGTSNITGDQYHTGGIVPQTGVYTLLRGEEVLTNSERSRRDGTGGGNIVNVYGVQDVDGLLYELKRRGIVLE